MKITFHGNSNFVFTGKKNSLNFNPDGQAKEDIVLFSGHEETNNTTGKIFSWPGEYEVSGIPIVGIKSPTSPAVIYRFNIDDISICILNGLKDKLNDEMLEKIGEVDLLIINMGGVDNFDGTNAHIAFEDVEPRVVIAFGNEGAMALFAKNLGMQPKAVDELELSKSSLPTDSTDFYVLNASN